MNERVLAWNDPTLEEIEEAKCPCGHETLDHNWHGCDECDCRRSALNALLCSGWLERHDAAARAEDAARLAEAVEERQAAWERADFLREGLETATNKAAAHAARLAEVERAFAGIRCALLHWQAEGVTQGVSCANCQSWAKSIAMPFFTARTSAALGVTAPTAASEAGERVSVTFEVSPEWPTPNNCRGAAEGLDAMAAARYGQILRAYADAEDARFEKYGPITTNPAPAEASEVEGSGCTCDQWPCEHEPLPITATITLPLDGLEETIAREVASWSDPRVWEHIPADVQERYLDQGRRLVARALAGDGAR